MMMKLKLGNELYIDSIKPDCEEKKQIIDGILKGEVSISLLQRNVNTGKYRVLNTWSENDVLLSEEAL